MFAATSHQIKITLQGFFVITPECLEIPLVDT